MQEGGSTQLITMILPFGLIILVFYFLIIRPQNKKQKDTQRMLAALKKNDRVVTIGGIRGTVVAVKDQTVVIKVDDSVKMEFSKSAVSSVVDSKEGPAESKESPSNNKKEENSDN
jgi:preprotein translocase subunit YajC